MSQTSFRSKSMVPSKAALKEELIQRLSVDLQTLERAQLAVQEAATHEEAKPENDKDTRALEQSYLARGQAKRVLELRTNLAAVHGMPLPAFSADKPIALGALVVVDEDEQTQTLFLAPHGGGLSLANGSVQVVTPQSPLGRAILGKCVGDDCSIRVAERLRELVISDVR